MSQNPTLLQQIDAINNSFDSLDFDAQTGIPKLLETCTSYQSHLSLKLPISKYGSFNSFSMISYNYDPLLILSCYLKLLLGYLCDAKNLNMLKF
jgi:hypothetical protein